jgi:hypothetical protein
MRLPKMNAVQTLSEEVLLSAAVSGDVAAANVAGESVQMAGVLDDLWGGIKSVGTSVVTEKTPCIAACGIDALRCITCATNLGCWARCAGPRVFPCIARCINS